MRNWIIGGIGAAILAILLFGAGWYFGGHDFSVVSLVPPTHTLPEGMEAGFDPFLPPVETLPPIFTPAVWTQCGQTWQVNSPGLYQMPDGSLVEIAPAQM